jgi:hypothetical protein
LIDRATALNAAVEPIHIKAMPVIYERQHDLKWASEICFRFLPIPNRR